MHFRLDQDIAEPFALEHGQDLRERVSVHLHQGFRPVSMTDDAGHLPQDRCVPMYPVFRGS
jgi:hypothetical protein